MLDTWMVADTISLASLLVALGQLIATGVGLCFVARQVRLAVNALEKSAEANLHSSESGELAHLMLVLAIENQLCETEIRAVEAEAEKNPMAKTLLLQYFEVLNRFCHCIRLGFVDEKTYKIDYRDKIRKVVERHPTVFDGASDFQHVQHVHQCWKKETDAADRKGLRRSQKSAS